jgi:hypothetical protein
LGPSGECTAADCVGNSRAFGLNFFVASEVALNAPDLLEVLFSCKACGLTDAKAKVRYRHDNEDVVHYFREVLGRAVGTAHAILSPLCSGTHCDLMIPFHDNQTHGIGCKPPE